MISPEKEYLNIKGKQCQPIHSKRFHSPNESLISLSSQTPSLPQLKLQAKQLLSQSIHSQISEDISINHVKPLICKNKSCIYLVRTLEEKVAKCILRIKEIAKENNILRKKLQMDRQIIDSFVPSTHRSLKSTDFKANIEEPRSNVSSVHDTYTFAKFHNEASFTNLSKPIHSILTNLNFVESQPILDCHWIKQSVKKLLINKCQKCNSQNSTSLVELDCNHYYHKSCLSEHLIEQSVWCTCRKSINKDILKQIGKPEQAIILEMKLVNQLKQMMQDNQAFYKCEQIQCPFVIIDKNIPENNLSFCQSCQTMRHFYKQEAIEK